MDELDETILAYLTQAPGSGFAGQVVAIADRWQGTDNLLWRVECQGQEAVIKFFVEAGQVRSQRQYDGQRLFALDSIAPEPLWLDRFPEGLPREVVVYRWVEGKAFEPGNGQHLAALAITLGRIHSFDREEVRRFCPHPVNLEYFWRILGHSVGQLGSWLRSEHYAGLAAVVDDLGVHARRRVDAALPLWHDAPHPVHGDVRAENCIDSFGSTMLVDWELFGLGDPALEVAAFLWESQTQLDESARAGFVAQYVDAYEQPEMFQRIDLYSKLLPLRSAAFLLDGVRQLHAADRAGDEFQANAVFIRETVWESVALAARQLSQIDIGALPGVREEVQRLIAGE